MGEAIKARGETEFASLPGSADEAVGARWRVAGVVLRFKNSDLKKIEAALGADFFRDFVERCIHGLVPIETVDLYLKHGVKKDGAPYEIPAETLDDIPVHDVVEVILEAVTRSMKGCSAKEYVEKVIEAMLKEPVSPSESPASTTGSTISESDPSGQDSE